MNLTLKSGSMAWVAGLLLFVACGGGGTKGRPDVKPDADLAVPADPGTEVLEETAGDPGPEEVSGRDSGPDLPDPAPDPAPEPGPDPAPDLADAPDVPPIPCGQPADCPAGLGCLPADGGLGTCGPCTEGSQCREGEGCVLGACGDCTANADCPQGRVCRKGDHRCHPCQAAGECDAGLGCVAGACGPCSEGPQCGGRLCIDSKCTDCVLGSDDQACRTQYADPVSFCHAGGVCSRACAKGADCSWIQAICGPEYQCVPCGKDDDCLADPAGQYPPGTHCIAGRCIQNPCASPANCVPTLPVCDPDAHVCRPCAKKGECSEVLGEAAVCTALSTCEPGDCGSAIPEENACPRVESGQLCAEHHCSACADKDDAGCQLQYGSFGGPWGCYDGLCGPGECHVTADCQEKKPWTLCAARFCVACTTQTADPDQACRDAFGSDAEPSWICLDDVCRKGDCHDHPDCRPSGQVCSTDHFCTDCGEDLDCKAPYSEKTVCESGQCVEGCEPGKCLSPGGAAWVCGGDNRCRACTADGDCTPVFGERYVCDSGACLEGCESGSGCLAGATGCVPGQVCGTDHRWHDCNDDPECRTVYDGDWLCESWLCVPGNCRGPADCAVFATLCVYPFCVPCSGRPDPDAECRTAYGDKHLCEGDTCIDGDCHKPVDCQDSGTLCGSDHLCTACTAFGTSTADHDLACKAEPYTILHYCAAEGTCAPGCQPGSPCMLGVPGCIPGQICGDDNRWTACKDDDQCSTVFAGQYLCKDGTCIPGTCKDQEDCNATGTLCLDFHCRSCTWEDPAPAVADAACREVFGNGHLCESDKCIAGDCHKTADCADDTLCKDHFCTKCTEFGSVAKAQDLACKRDFTDLYVCLADRCVPGCAANSPCLSGTEGCVQGQVCGDDNRWTACKDDPQCETLFGVKHLCEGGLCIPGDCRKPGDCPHAGSLCVDRECRTCTGAQPSADLACEAAYGQKHLCESGACIAGDCHDQTACNATGTVCTNHRCTACTALGDTKELRDAACRLNYTDDAICDADRCKPGCAPGAVCPNGEPACKPGQVCGPDNRWKNCSDDMDCGSGRICESGSCIAGDCHGQSDCAKTLTLCIDHACRACTTQALPDAACEAAYGSKHLCQEGACIAGDCHDQAGCDKAGTVCSDHLCTPCSALGQTLKERDEACEKAYKSLQYRCDAEKCVAGCVTGSLCPAGNAECQAGQVCGDDNRWRDCVEDLECSRATGNPAFLCDPLPSAGGARRCQAGCTAPSYDWQGQVCGTDHRFRDCKEDTECAYAYQDLKKICDPVKIGGNTYLRCKNGLEPGNACSIGGKEVVGDDHRCHPCTDFGTLPGQRDGACLNAYGKLYICESGDCVAGCAPGSQCSNGWLCRSDNRCTPCKDVTEDGLCGTNFLCVQGECTLGNCRYDSDCDDGKVCLSHACEPCSETVACANGYVCVSGACVKGTCCNGPGCTPVVSCGTGITCKNYSCTGCTKAEDCHKQWPCLDKGDACKPDGTCRGTSELDVLSGYCFIKNVCVEIGKSVLDPSQGKCHVCYWEDVGGKVVGSKTDWTPGNWDTLNGFKPDWCFIGNSRCIEASTVEETVSGYATDQSASCRMCDPRLDVPASLRDWSPRPDPVLDPHAEWFKRHTCDDPLFVAPGQAKDSRTPAYAGNASSGYCWQGECRGISWTPWLPLGPNAAGVSGGVTVGGKGKRLFSTFGGGFGSGIPSVNPGCHKGSSCTACPFTPECE